MKRFLLTLLLAFPLPARATVGPQNLALVVNANSPASVTLANAYASARHIPPANVIFIDLPNELTEIIDVGPFRDRILTPVCDAIRDRNLGRQIDCILYSADFPHAVRLNADVGDRQLPKTAAPLASINGLTYLYLQTLARDLAYLSLTSNRYAPAVHRNRDPAMPPPRPFRRTTGWNPDGSPMPGHHPERGYMLSMVLGVTAGRGNSVDEITAMIRRSVAADGTAPRGTIYFSINDDIRAKTRQWAFVPTAAKLKQLGVAAEICGVLPANKKNVAGAVVGIADFNWPASGSTLLPGAIAEHLTSTGGVMANYGQQTPISAWIRAGAAGTSGTVVEPFAIQEKFPSPFIHAYYAAGCSLAEAFYQSVSGPYQLLILGDPLCRPWGLHPDLRLNLQPNERLKGTKLLEPTCPTPGYTVDRYDLYIDGRLVSSAPPGKPLPLDTTPLPDGHHTLHLVATGQDPLQTQAHRYLPIIIDNHNRRFEITQPPPAKIAPTAQLEIGVSLPGSKQITLSHLGRVLTTIDGPAGQLKVPAQTLGHGIATLSVAGTYHLPTGAAGFTAPPLYVTVSPAP